MLMITPAAVGTHSEPCGPWWQTVPAGANDGESSPVYVAVDERLPGDWLFSVWVFAEANGVDGLQRHDAGCYDVDANGNAYTDETADTVVF